MPLELTVDQNGQVSLEDLNNIVRLVNELNTPIKRTYVAYISQSGYGAPTEDIILQDDFSSLTWSYSDVGIYTVTKGGAFSIANKCIPNKITSFIDAVGNLITLERTSANSLTLKTYAASDISILSNNVLSGQIIEITVYN